MTRIDEAPVDVTTSAGPTAVLGIGVARGPLRFEAIEDAPFGAVVRGVTWEGLDGGDVRRIEVGLRSHLLLVLRGQRSPTEAELDGWLAQFGRLTLATFEGQAHYAGHLNWTGKPLSEMAEAQKQYMTRSQDNTGSTMYRPGAAGISELVWHNDPSHRPMLKVLSLLEMTEMDDEVTPTEFRDMYTACECLDPTERERLARRQVVYFDPRIAGPDELPRLADATHPIVLAHPHTGRRAIYVNDVADRVVGMDRPQSDELLARLADHVDASARRLVHHWQHGDVVLWDNVGLQHRRDHVPPNQLRVLRQHGGLAE